MKRPAKRRNSSARPKTRPRRR
ncbi:UNVERIFIED_CONTAM: hypothetical protein GTU68_045269 [Idotea baltica]|nr:hypothetical protein [Idotea baltica]